MINSLDRITGNVWVRWVVYLLMALMAITMIVLSFVQIWIANTTEEMTAYGSIPAEPNGWPRSDQRGAFLILNEGHTREYTGTLVQLLPVTTAGVIDEEAGAHFLPADLQSILIQAAALYEPTAYRVERIGDPEPGEMIVEPQPGTKVLLIAPRTGVWKPGAYVIDIPMDGMDGGRLYFQFYIDKE